MGNNVFANGREVSCKAADGKSICAFPDVCMTPPENPATPPGVPVPYPNTGMAKDTAGGSKTVKISKKETMLKNQSHFKKSTGDEAGSAAKKGVVTSVNRGKIYFNSWSMDVKFEGKNIVRHLDMTTHNHASMPGQTGPWPYGDSATPPAEKKNKPCNKDCPKQPDDDRKKKLRSKSPSKEIQKKANLSTPKRCGACGQFAKTLAADHIVPLDTISRMPGFACLSEKDQEEIANAEENFMGLCGSCNSSKKAKLWHTWKGHKKRNLTWNPERRKDLGKTTNDLLKKLKASVKGKECAGKT